MVSDRVVGAARLAEQRAIQWGLIDAPVIEGSAFTTAAPSPLAVRGYLALLRARHRDGAVPRLDLYSPAGFGDAETIRATGAIEAGWIDAYRFALRALEGFAGVECRELDYLATLAGSWRYERDDELADVPVMCSVVGLFSWFLELYRELDFADLASWERADARCEARNAWLAARDRGAATAAALDVLGAEERDPALFAV